MRLLLLISVLLIPFSTFGQAPVAARPASPATRTSSDLPPLANSVIRGRVIYDDNERPVRRAGISLMTVPVKSNDMTASPEPSPQLVNIYGIRSFTDMNGNFELRNVPPGSFYPIIDSQGVLNAESLDSGSISWTGKPDAMAEFYERIVTDGVSVVDVIIRAKRSAAISGTIRYADGDPAIGQTVEAVPRTRFGFSKHSGKSTQTDDRGYFRFPALPRGEFIVRVLENVSHSGNKQGASASSSKVQTYYNGGTESKEPQVIALELGVERSDVDITLAAKPLFNVRGKIIEKSTKNAVNEGSVTMRSISDDEHRVYDSNGTVTSLNGDNEWNFRDLPSGKYEVSFNRPYSYDGRESPDNPNRSRRLAEAKVQIEINESDVSDIILELPFESVVKGTIRIDGGKTIPSDLYIGLYDEDLDQSYSVSIERSIQRSEDKPSSEPRIIEFKIDDVQAGNYAIQLYANRKYYLKSAKLGSLDLKAVRFRVDEATDIDGIKLEASSEMAKLHGTAVDSDNNKLNRGRVVLVPVDENRWATGSAFEAVEVTDSGTFRLDVEPGEYYIFAYVGQRAFGRDPKMFDQRIREVVKGAARINLKVGDNPAVVVKERPVSK